MKMKLLVLLLMSTSLLFSQEIKEKVPESTTKVDSTVIDEEIEEEGLEDEILDGYWWIETGQWRLKPYMVGLFDGLSLGTSIVLQRFNHNDFCYNIGAKAANQYLKRFDTLQIHHFGDSLDDFYADPINVKIRFENAFNYILYKVTGENPKKLNSMLEAYRKEGDERYRMLEEKGSQDEEEKREEMYKKEEEEK